MNDNYNKIDFLKEYSIDNHKIMAMEQEKRNRLIQEAMREFSRGYKAANTDRITQNAGISKGLLFHYFGSKKELFLFLVKYAVDLVTGQYIKLSFESRDFLENMWKISLLAIDLTYKYPETYQFLVKGFFSLNEIFPEGLPREFGNPTEELMFKIYQSADTSYFRDDIDPDKARQIIIWTMKGFSDRLLLYGSDIDNYKRHYEDIETELKEYLQVLRKILYR